MAELPRLLILQVADGPDYSEMLRITSARHQDYARRHGFDLWQGQFSVGSYIMWQRWEIALLALRMGYEFIACIDADAIIVKTNVDLRDALPVGEHLGMVYGRAPGGEPEHYNAGVCYLRNTPEMQSFLGLLLKRAPSRQYQHISEWWNDEGSDQRVLNDLLRKKRWQNLVRPIDRRWNAVPYDKPFSNPVVLHLAGEPDNGKRKEVLRHYA